MRAVLLLISSKSWTTCTELPQTSEMAKGTTRGTRKAAAVGHVLVVHGPNLNLLGTREPSHYGRDSLADIDARLQRAAAAGGVRISIYQSNSEALLIERIQRAPADRVDFIIINPAAFTHTSVALRDALAAIGIPFVEVHLSNVHAREDFRRHSYFSDIARGVISGLGAYGYEAALAFAMARR